jgi:tRNA (guanine37-N1)-methyltransferase
MLFAKVKKEIAEQTRQQLIDAGVLSKDFKIIRDDDYVFFPLNKKLDYLETVDLEPEPVPFKYLNLQEQLSKFLSHEEMEKVVTSFDIIGDLVIAEIPEELVEKEKQIANAILQVHRSAKVVAKKTGAMSGEFRVRPLKVIAGENRTETLYKESGVQMKLDPSKVYFSVRLATERKRIADQVKPGERILALFAGVGPFPLVISKVQPDCEIVAIELNPDAFEYMQQNTRLNRTQNIKTILGDARKVVLKNYQNRADRIIMPLPHTAEDFLDVAFAGARNNCIVHFYGFAPEKDIDHAFEEKIAAAAARTGNSTDRTSQRSMVHGKEEPFHWRPETVHRHIVRPYAPGIVQVVVDFKVKKE